MHCGTHLGIGMSQESQCRQHPGWGVASLCDPGGHGDDRGGRGRGFRGRVGGLSLSLD